VEERIMHNWYEMYVLGRERASDLASLSRSIRTARETNAAPETPAAVVRLETGKDTIRAGATFVLQRDEVISIRARRRPYRVACVAGRLWTTIDGGSTDSVLTAGEWVEYHRRGRIVIQALRTAAVRIECPRAAEVVVASPMRPVFQFG
jgi:hypothetical protein